MSPEVSRAYINIANVHYQNGDLKKAVSFYEQALKYAPNDPTTLLNLSCVFYETGKFKKAKAFYLKAVTIDPTLDREDYKVIAMHNEKQTFVGSKASNKGTDRMTPRWDMKRK